MGNFFSKHALLFLTLSSPSGDGSGAPADELSQEQVEAILSISSLPRIPTPQELAYRETHYQWSDKILGQGEFSVVHKAILREDGRAVAIKRVAPNALTPQRVQQMYAEARTLSQIAEFKGAHHFVRLLEGFLDHQGGICLVMDRAGDADLFELIEENPHGMPEREAKLFLKQIFSAIEELHSHDLAHLDIKLENIMYDRKTNKIKLIDFGFTRPTQQIDPLSGRSMPRMQTQFCGSLDYSAPEILRHTPYDGKRADVWSLGVLTFVLLTGDYPFEGKKRVHTMQNIVRGKYEMPPHLSPEAQSLLRRMIQRYPDNRCHVGSLLRHPWFQAK